MMDIQHKSKVLLATIICLMALNAFGEEKPTFPKPRHVIYINMDDLGYGDASCYGATAVQTPNVDALAASGIRFTDAHTTAAFCSPSRYSLMTGRHSLRSNHHRLRAGLFLPDGARGAIELDRYTLPKLFKKAGYTTALIGKWHLGDGTEDDPKKYNKDDYWITHGPLDSGFDYFYGHIADRHLEPKRLAENRKLIRDEAGNFINTNDLALDEPTGLFARRAVRYLKENTDKSIFLYLNPNVAHLPHTPSDAFKGKSNAGYYGDFLVEGDWLVGEVIEALRELNVLDQTLLIYTSDNGGDDIAYTARTSFPRWPKYYAKQGIPKDEFPWIGGGHKIRGVLAGSKASMKEGGHRVPMIVHWPQFIKTAKVSDTMFSQMDILASFGSLLNIPIPKGEAEDSKDALVNLLGMDAAPVRKEFIIIGKDGNAVRQGDWKLCVGDWSMLPDLGQKPTREKSVRLFNIKKDMGETTNLAMQYPEKVTALSALLEQYLSEYKKR